MDKRIIGIKGELLAIQYLQEKGYGILARNYRYKRSEIDIIAQNENLILFIEVKFRSTSNFGFPEQMVSEAQAIRITAAAEEFLAINGYEHQLIRFDILAISPKGKGYNIEHFEDAFY